MVPIEGVPFGLLDFWQRKNSRIWRFSKNFYVFSHALLATFCPPSQVAGFWNRNSLLLYGALGLAVILILWRVMFWLASIFLNFSGDCQPAWQVMLETLRSNGQPPGMIVSSDVAA